MSIGEGDAGPSPRSRSAAVIRRVDPITPLAGLLGLSLFALHGFRGVLTRDLAFYAYAGQAFADGLPPYEGVFNQTGPLAHMVPAMGVWAAGLIGADELLAMRVLFCVLAAGCVSAAYVVGRSAFSSRAVGVVAAATLASFSGFVELASNGPREKTTMVLFLLLALGAASRERWFTGGVFVGLATLVLQTAFFVGCPALVVAALVASARGGRLTSLTRFVAGGGAALAVVFLYFVLAGAVRSFADGFLLVNLRYPTRGELDVAWIGEAVVDGFGPSSALLVVGLLGACLLPLTGRSRRLRHSGMVAGISAGAFAGVLWILVDFDNWPDVFLVLPVASLGMGGTVDALLGRVPRRVGMVAGGCVTVLALALSLLYSLDQRPPKLDRQRASVTKTMRILGDDVSIVSIEAPQPLVLAGKRNPSRYQLLGGALGQYVDDTWPGGRRGYRAWVLRTHPDLVALGDSAAAHWARAFSSDYRSVGCAPGWEWYAARSLGEERLDALLAANRFPCPR